MTLLQVTGKEAEYKSILINCWLLCQKKSHFSISKNLKLFVFDCRNRKIPLELKVKAGNFPKARENAVVQITVSVSFASYWFWEWREISRPIAERNKAKPEQYRITLDSQMKMALSGTEFFLSCFSYCRSHWTASEHSRWSYELPGLRISWAASGHHEYEWTLQPITYDFHSICW